MTKIKNFFKSITNSKKKVFALALSVCVVVLSIASSSIAYFTDTEKFTNTFTSGNVDIELSEATVQKNDTTGNIEAIDAENNRIAANEAPETQEYGSVFPNQSIYKDPTIKNIGSEAAYVGAIVTITATDIDGVLTNADAVKAFIVGLPTDAKIQIEDNKITIYVVYTTALVKNEKAVVFTGLKMSNAWDNTEMAKIDGLEIVVDAYAVQSAGMTSGALAALKDAFDAFDSIS